MRKNKFEDNNHLKSIQMKENLEFLTERPTNNIGGVYVVEPEYIVQDPEIPGEVTREADFTQDDSASDTTGLFDDDGTILTIEPPITVDSPDRSYILGPMSSMWYAWGNFTTIGYIRESDRRMVNLGRITGQLQNWDGVSNFTSYGQLTLEQAVWFRDTPKYLNGYDNYRAFYPGPPSNTPDQYGRYLCTITGTPKPTTITPPPRRVPPVTGGPNAAGYPWGNNPTQPRPTTPNNLPTNLGNAPPDPIGNLILLGITYVLARTLVTRLGLGTGTAAPIVPRVINALKNLKPKPVYRPTKATYGGTPKTTNPTKTPTYNPKQPGGGPEWQRAARNWQRQNPGKYNPYRSDSANQIMRQQGVGTKPDINPKFRKPIGESYQTKGELIAEGLEELPVELIPIIHNILVDMGGYTSENIDKLIAVIEKHSKPVKPVKESKQDIIEKYEKRRKILRDIKRPYVLPEQKKVKYHFKLKRYRNANRTINSDLMKQAEVPTSFKRPDERLWGKYEKEKNARNSQDKKNVVLDHLGGGDHFLEYILETGREKGNSILYNNFGGKKPKKVVSREQLKGDVLLFIADETGNKTPILQSKINQDLDFEFSKDLFEMYFQEQETLQADKDPLFKKVSNKLKTEIDYENKPSKMGYPNTPPPKMVNGWHPEYGKDKGYYNKLDPVSAISMPKTGNSEIDRKVRAAAKKKKVEENLKNSYLETKYSWKNELIIPVVEKVVEIKEPKVKKIIEVSREKSGDQFVKNAISEGMTTSGMFQTTFPAEGDTVLTDVPATDDAMGSLFGLEVDGEIKFGTVQPGGGQFSNNWYQWATTNNYDTSLLSHLSFRVTAGTGNNAPLPAHPLKIDYYAYDGDGSEYDNSFSSGSITGSILSSGEYNFELPPDARKKNTFFQFKVDSFDEDDSESYRTDYLSRLAMGGNFWGATVADAESAARIWDIVNASPGTSDSSKSISVTSLISDFYNGREYGGFDPMPVSGYTNGHTEADRLYLWDWIRDNFSDLNGAYSRTFTVSNIGLKRRTPVNVFVSLDSPEASAFIRTDPIMQGLSAAERYKKLEDMLNAGDEYILKALGIQSMSARPAETQMPPTWQQAADEVDYGEDLTPLSDNPYGTELGQIAMAGDLGMLGMGIEGLAAALSLGVAGLMQVYGMSKEMATWFFNKYSSDPYGTDQAGPETTGDNPRAKNLTPQQQADADAAGKELRDAQRELNDAEESGNQTKIDMAKERVDRASKRRQSLRKKHREENKHRTENYEPVGKVLAEKKRLKSPKDLQNKIPGYYDGKPSPLGFPDNPPPKLVNGMHPDLVDGKKVADRFNKLDPESAKAMPPTGNPHIDRKVRAAAKKKK